MQRNTRRNFLKSSAIGVASFVGNEALASSIEIRKITPPNLDDAYLGQKTLCYRPMRHGSPNLSVTKVVTCLVLSDQFHLETLAPVINFFCHPATNSAGV